MDMIGAAKLLELIQLSYPNAFRDADDDWKRATINMWQISFPDVPYPIMEQAFNHFRMTSKFPPTVAEMVEELKNVHRQAEEGANISKIMGNRDRLEQFIAVMRITSRYTKPDDLGGLRIDRLPALSGGEGYERLGASRNRVDREDGLSLLDAGWGAGGS